LNDKEFIFLKSVSFLFCLGLMPNILKFSRSQVLYNPVGVIKVMIFVPQSCR